MRTIQLSVAGAVIVVLLGGLAAAAAAQSGEATEPEVTTVSGNRLTVELDMSEVEHSDDGWTRGLIAIETHTWSDSRLPADMRSRLNLTAGRVIVGAVLLEDPDGSWSGTWEAFARDDGSGQGMLRLTGSGAYDGLIAFLQASTDDGNCVECLEYEGIIVEGEMPPMPELLEPIGE